MLGLAEHGHEHACGRAHTQTQAEVGASETTTTAPTQRYSSNPKPQKVLQISPPRTCLTPTSPPATCFLVPNPPLGMICSMVRDQRDEDERPRSQRSSYLHRRLIQDVCVKSLEGQICSSTVQGSCEVFLLTLLWLASPFSLHLLVPSVGHWGLASLHAGYRRWASRSFSFVLISSFLFTFTRTWLCDKGRKNCTTAHIWYKGSTSLLTPTRAERRLQRSCVIKQCVSFTTICVTEYLNLHAHTVDHNNVNFNYYPELIFSSLCLFTFKFYALHQKHQGTVLILSEKPTFFPLLLFFSKWRLYPI